MKETMYEFVRDPRSEEDIYREAMEMRSEFIRSAVRSLWRSLTGAGGAAGAAARAH
ncbi:RSP_7527 family protein [Azospirillum thermophilum]|uniref:RSP_7527 family protein n=1 Tax=Azospirillum thermophilum TaxID=2202148 RepID=UPI00143DA1E0|nr:hypothetical protein [Azospirillum thermophilum]